MAQPVFNNLPDAQAYARANGVTKYFRVHYTDATTRIMRARGGWGPTSYPAFRIYMDIAQAMEDVTKRALSPDHGRVEIETLWTDDVSDSPAAH